MTTASPATTTSPSDGRRERHRSRRVERRPTPYLIITNISKRQNVRNLLQIAAAHGVATVFVAGQRGFEFDPDAADTDIPPAIQDGVRTGRLTIARFDKLEECVGHIRRIVEPCRRRRDDGEADDDDDDDDDDAPSVRIIGVEIDNSSRNLEDEPFASHPPSSSSSVAFMMGNEGSGMTSKQMSACDGFVRVSQYGGGTASLNVSVAAGLVLHRFLHWSRGDRVGGYGDDSQTPRSSGP
jgi:hypothetical protein